ncbi:MAG: adenylate/guanylate cyclase domain-containing protein, partial [Pseudomonadota bacterium]
ASVVAPAAAFAWWGWRMDMAATLAAAALGGLFAALARRRDAMRAQARLSRERTRLGRFVPAAFREPLAEVDAEGFGAAEAVLSVLFVDAVGFTRAAERLSAREVAAKMSDLHRRFEATAEAHGGVVVSYIGDGALIAFGLSGEGPEAALRCADALTAEGSGEDLLRATVDRGPVSVAVLGGARHSTVTVAGDPVNVAARLQEAARAEGRRLVVTAAAMEGVEGAAPGLEPLGAFALRGRAAPVTLFGR